MADITIQELNNFQQFFAGNSESHGVHIYGSAEKGSKEKGKSFTKVEHVAERHYREHLEGKSGLGIVPIQKDNTCRFAAIDVDIYSIDFRAQLEVIYNHNIPLCPFRSKSGGLHLYLFFSESTKVAKVKGFMEELRVLLGLSANTEIFPKQMSLTDGQTGNWINLPYYNASETKQYMMSAAGEPMILAEALQTISDKLQTEKTLREFLDSLPLADGPPCLQHIYLFRDTTHRNEYLFSLARYYKTKHGDDFEQHILDANERLKRPIESKSELQQTVIASHKKKDYSYRCSEEPIVKICAKSLCLTRKFGVGGPEVSQLSYEDFIKYETDPPYYEWIVNGTSLRFFSENEIISQMQFRVLCFRELHILPVKIKELNWAQIVNRALQNIQVRKIEEGDDISPGAIFREYLAEFLVKRAQAQNKEQILIDRVYHDAEKGSYVFRPKNLIDFLYMQKNFRYYKPTEIQDRLRQLGGIPTRYFVSKQTGQIRAWVLPFAALTKFVGDEGSVDKFEVNFKEEFDEKAF